MAADPLLVLQMQRMGDLILTFPLLMSLKRLWPEHPIWVAAEPRFFQDLMPLSPDVTFFSPSHCSELAHGRYKAAINLSSRPEAAVCLAKVQSDLKFGPAATDSGIHVHGYWHLYRAALTHNNRHNTIHWSDLFMRDISESSGTVRQRRTGHPERIGLVLGASEAAKRPEATFWARLAECLVKAGAAPLFLGGAAESPLGEEVARLAGLPQANLCGRLTLNELAALMRTLNLCISPDTGPMHLADWLGVPVLNLSMGPVNARETGPVSPGQWILRANMSCVGCWQCRHASPFCKLAFTPQTVADIALALLDDPHTFPKTSLSLHGLCLFHTGRDTLGLHCLVPAPKETASPQNCRFLLENFWRAAFLYLHKPENANMRSLAAQCLADLCAAFPKPGNYMGRGLVRLTAQCAARLKSRDKTLPADFWRAEAPLLRPFTGNLHMFLQNENYSRSGWQSAVDRLTLLGGLFSAKSAD